jgi:hypothetical protein
MAATKIILGACGYSGLLVLLGAAMLLGGRGAARRLGVPTFRYFDARPTSAAWWRVLLVRIASAAAPFGICVLLWWISWLVNGVSVSTTFVEVHDGPAKDAGMRTGDRVETIGGERVADWEQLRVAVQRSSGATPVNVEREGQKLELIVTPRAGRIGIAMRDEMTPIGPIAAASRAISTPFSVIASSAKDWLHHAAGPQQTELRGPVGIISETSRAPRSGALFTFFALLASYLWPLFAGVPLFDAVTARVFHAAHPEAAVSSSRGYRLERLRQALLLAASGYLTALFMLVLVQMGLPAAVILALWSVPAAAAAYPLLWIAGKEVWGRWAALPLALSPLLPCIGAIAVIALLATLQRELRAEGFRVHLFSVEPPQPS